VDYEGGFGWQNLGLSRGRRGRQKKEKGGRKKLALIKTERATQEKRGNWQKKGKGKKRRWELVEPKEGGAEMAQRSSPHRRTLRSLTGAAAKAGKSVTVKKG